MAKRKFKTWAFAEEAYDRESKNAGLLHMALTDVLEGKVEWVLQAENGKAGLSRLDAPHGGILILFERGDGKHGSAEAYYADDWTGMVRKMPAPGFSDPESTEAWNKLQNLMHEVKRRQNAVHERLMAEARR